MRLAGKITLTAEYLMVNVLASTEFGCTKFCGHRATSITVGCIHPPHLAGIVPATLITNKKKEGKIMKRTNRIKFWVKDEELAQIESEAKKEGLSRSAFIR